MIVIFQMRLRSFFIAKWVFADPGNDVYSQGRELLVFFLDVEVFSIEVVYRCLVLSLCIL